MTAPLASDIQVSEVAGGVCYRMRLRLSFSQMLRFGCFSFVVLVALGVSGFAAQAAAELFAHEWTGGWRQVLACLFLTILILLGPVAALLISIAYVRFKLGHVDIEIRH